MRDSIRAAVATSTGRVRVRWCRRSWTATTPACPSELADAFRTSGLTHLLAVSGTNLTLVVGSLLLLARWVGVRARGLVVVGVARRARLRAPGPDPSPASSGLPRWARSGWSAWGTTVGNGVHAALGAAVLLLLLVDPWLARSPGFALSALATAGILWLAPGWRDRLAALAAALGRRGRRRAPRGPAGLHPARRRDLRTGLAWSPSPPNLLAAPVVGPATVLGLAWRRGRAGVRRPRHAGSPCRPPGAPPGSSRWRSAVCRPARGRGRLVLRPARDRRPEPGCARCVALCLGAAAGPPCRHARARCGDGRRSCWCRCPRRAGHPAAG